MEYLDSARQNQQEADLSLVILTKAASYEQER